jgi:ankyrin repeat protein
MIITRHAAKYDLQRFTKKLQLATTALLLSSLPIKAWAADNGAEQAGVTINRKTDRGSTTDLRLSLQQTSYTALELAIQKEQTDVVAYLLARGADPNKYAFHAPLLTAVLAKNTQVVKLLLDAGANINVGQGKVVPSPPTRHITGNVIHIAAAMNQQPIVELLLKREKTEQIQAALFAALANDHDTLVDWLLDQNPELNWQNKEGETLLMRVALTGDSKRFNTLIAEGADPLKRTRFGDTALAYAVHAPSLEVFEQLLKLDTDTLSIQQALIQAIVTGQRNVFDRCLSLLNTVNRPDYLGNTPLIYAVIYNRLNWISDLLALGADVNQSNKWGHTPLMFAVVNKTPPHIDRRDEPHLGLPTAINYGIWSVSRHHPNSDALVPMLIKAGANPNAQDKKYGDTALIKAVAEGNIAGVRQLLASGANLEHLNLSGYSVKEVLLDNIEYDKETEDQEDLKIHMQINEILKAHEQKK